MNPKAISTASENDFRSIVIIVFEHMADVKTTYRLCSVEDTEIEEPRTMLAIISNRVLYCIRLMYEYSVKVVSMEVLTESVANKIGFIESPQSLESLRVQEFPQGT